MSDTVNQLVRILTEKSLGDGEPDAETPLEDLGLDSLDLINFLFSIEEEIGVKIPDSAIVDDDLDNLTKIAAYIDARKS